MQLTSGILNSNRFYTFALCILISMLSTVTFATERVIEIGDLTTSTTFTSHIPSAANQTQEFLADVTCDIKQIEIFASISLNGHPFISIDLLIDGAVVSSKILNSDVSEEIISFDLATPFPIIAGVEYTLEVDNNAPDTDPPTTNNSLIPLLYIFHQAGNAYDGGECGCGPDLDLKVRITCECPVAPVPTMSQWGLILFALLLMNLAVSSLGQMKLAQKGTEGQQSAFHYPSALLTKAQVLPFVGVVMIITLSLILIFQSQIMLPDLIGLPIMAYLVYRLAKKI